MTENKKRQVHLYGHDFEVVVGEKDFLTGKYQVLINYLGYPTPFGQGIGYSVDDAIDNAARKALETPLDAVKCLYD